MRNLMFPLRCAEFQCVPLAHPHAELAVLTYIPAQSGVSCGSQSLSRKAISIPHEIEPISGLSVTTSGQTYLSVGATFA